MKTKSKTPSSSSSVKKKAKKKSIQKPAAVSEESKLTTKTKKPQREGKWDSLVTLSQQHPYFSFLFEFARADVCEEGWKKPKSSNKSAPSIIAMDCEMCTVEHLETGIQDNRALVRVSLVDGEDPDKGLLDLIVKQPQPGFRVVDFKTDIHGIQPETILNAPISFETAQKRTLKFISRQTIVVGHSISGDLVSMKISHDRVIDTSLIFKRGNCPDEKSTPGLKDLAHSLFDLDMPDSHDSYLDAKVSMQAAAYSLSKGSKIIRVLKSTTGPKLRIHNLPQVCNAEFVQDYIVKNASVVPLYVDPVVVKNSKSGQTVISFLTQEHADLAFKTIAGEENIDKIGRKQKKIVLKLPTGKKFLNTQLGYM